MEGYRIIYADPPWRYFNPDAPCGTGRHYGTMTTDMICGLPVGALAAETARLFLWTTMPQIPDALRVMAAWGFEYRTCAFCWVKSNRSGGEGLFWGLGYYTRSNAELCLLGRRGGAMPRASRRVHQVVITPVREHSRKPDEVRDGIVELFGDLPRIELFARERVPGWDAWGVEVESDIVLPGVV